jgi:CBS domain-containing protein
VTSSSPRAADTSENAVERTTVHQSAPGPGGHDPRAEADTGGDGVRQHAGRRTPQETPADAAHDEDGGEREVVWETVRFVCVTETHHADPEEEPHRDERERRRSSPTVGNEATDEKHGARGDSRQPKEGLNPQQCYCVALPIRGMESLERPVSEVMTEPIRSVPPETPVSELATILLEESIGSVVVAEADGIVTKTDLLTEISSSNLTTPASELMTDPVVTVSRDADIQTAIDRMDEHEIKRVVVEDSTEAVGVVSTTDIRQALTTDFDSVIAMFAGATGADAEDTYECISCGERVTAASKPGTCDACDSPMRNISMPRD